VETDKGNPSTKTPLSSPVLKKEGGETGFGVKNRVAFQDHGRGAG